MLQKLVINILLQIWLASPDPCMSSAVHSLVSDPTLHIRTVVTANIKNPNYNLLIIKIKVNENQADLF